MHSFLIFSVIVFALLGLIWNKSDLPNGIVKVFFLGSAFYGLMLLAGIK